MRKILFVAHMDSHIANFHLPYLKWFQDQGYETHVASNSLEKTKEIKYCDFKHQVDFARFPFSLRNLKVYRQLFKLVRENEFALVHAHTPIGGLISRLVCRRTKTPVIYTAHGFHFLKGGSKLSWLLYYPVEKFLSRYTSELITINDEDYQLAKKKFSKKCNLNYVPGVGVDLSEYSIISEELKVSFRKSLSLAQSDFLLVYVAEQTKGKNQKFLIKMMDRIRDRYPNVKLLLIGYGREANTYKKLILDLNLEARVLQLGYRKDILELINIADLIVSASLREGLPKALLEALAIGKPLLVSDIRGNHDLVSHNLNGYLYPANDLKMFLKYFEKLYNNQELREKFAVASRKKAKEFALELVLTEVSKIYNKYLNPGKQGES